MRVVALGVWLRAAVQNGMAATVRVGRTLAKKIRPQGAIDAGGVGDDETGFGGSRSRIWLEFVEGARAQLLQIFERSWFERFPRAQRWLRKVLGTSAPPPPPVSRPRPKITGPLGAHQPTRDQQLEAHVRERIQTAHTREAAGLRDNVAKQRDLKPKHSEKSSGD